MTAKVIAFDDMERARLGNQMKTPRPRAASQPWEIRNS
jgi:hypothetical protein